MSHVVTCPYCSAQIRVPDRQAEQTFICPRCLADVNNPRTAFGIQAADINTDVKRGLSAGSIVLAVLMGLCVLGILLGILIPTPPEAYGVMVNALPLMFCFALLDVLVSIAVIRGLIRWSIPSTRALSVGRLLGIAFLSLGSIAAIVIFFFATCMGLLKIKSP